MGVLSVDPKFIAYNFGILFIRVGKPLQRNDPVDEPNYL